MGIFTAIPYELRRCNNIKAVYRKLDVAIFTCYGAAFLIGCCGYIYYALIFMDIGLLVDFYKGKKFARMPYEGDM